MTRSHGLSRSALFLAGVLTLFPLQDYSLRVNRAVTPFYPDGGYEANVAVAAIEMDRAGKRLNTELVYGESPFAGAALDALTHWKFSPSPSADMSRTSVTFVFRPRSMERVPLTARISGQQRARPNRPPLPLEMFDTGYPQTCDTEGAVVLELSVNEKGEVDDVAPILGFPSLTGAVEMEVKSWKFLPATVDGKPVRGRAVVVISFVHPAL